MKQTDVIQAEYIRLKNLFLNVDESKAKLVDELLRKASFLKWNLDTLEQNIIKNGSIEKSNKGNIRESIYYKTYLQTVNVYQSIIKTLNTIMGKNVIDPDDEFDDFMSKLWII